jgi:YVTN family beta-propeller protein
MRRPLPALGGLALLPLVLCSSPGPAPPRPTTHAAYKSPLGLAVDQAGKRAYVALRTAGAVAVVDLEAGKVLAEVPVGRGPYDVALAAGKLFVSCEDDDALAILDAARPALLRKIPVGQAPRGVAVAPDGSVAYVLCHDEQALRCVDLNSGKAQSLPLPGWPERVVLHRKKGRPELLALSSGPGQAIVSLIRPGSQLRVLTTNELRGVSNARGLASAGALPRIGGQSWVTYGLVIHQRPRTQIPTTQVSQGWVFTNAVSTLESNSSGLGEAGNVLDDPVRGHADPSDVVLSADRRYTFIACGGADTVLAARTELVAVNVSLQRSLWQWGYGSENLARTRLYVAARLATQANPRRLALSGDGSTLVVSNYLGDSLTVIDARALRVRRHIPLGGPPPDAARRGQILFNSGRMTFQGQFSCASCHPDGGADGLNWDLTRDGVGNFNNTRSLLGVKDTAPYGWYGSSPTLADRVTGTLRNLHRHEPSPAEVSDLVAYLKTLAPPRPLPQRKEDVPAARRGRTLFEGKAGCSRCHLGPTLQDCKAHDVGTLGPQDPYDRIDTPSLRGVARTAPYLHDGRAATLEEIFMRYNPSRRHGAAHLLTAEEWRDLMVYLRSL